MLRAPDLVFSFGGGSTTQKHCLILTDYLLYWADLILFPLPYPPLMLHLLTLTSQLHTGEQTLIVARSGSYIWDSVPDRTPAKWILDAKDICYVGRTIQNIAVFRLQGPVLLQGDGWHDCLWTPWQGRLASRSLQDNLQEFATACTYSSVLHWLTTVV